MSSRSGQLVFEYLVILVKPDVIHEGNVAPRQRQSTLKQNKLVTGLPGPRHATVRIEIAGRCDAVLVTRGEQGSEIRAGDERFEIPPVPAPRVVDPTACGDAYRAGVLYGRARGLSWDVAGRIGSLIGSYQVESLGTQSLRFELDDFRARFEREFGFAL